MKRLSLLFFASLIVLLTACPGNESKKSDEDIAKENLSVTWKVTTPPTSTPAGSFSDDYKQITMTFSSTGTYSLSIPGGSNIPYSAAPANRSNGNWKFNTALNQVILDEGTSDAKTLEIETLSATNFIFHFSGKIPAKYVDSGTITYSMIP
jgi:hypothetical protein